MIIRAWFWFGTVDDSCEANLKAIVATSVGASTSPINLTYTHQYLLIFQQSGLSSDASETVLTMGTNTYTQAQLPLTGMWVDNRTTLIQ
jgi:hypothetical protein